MKTMNAYCRKTLTALLTAAVAIASEAVTVNSVADLQREIANATTGTEILIAAGTYNLADKPAMNAVGHLYLTQKVTLRGATGNPKDVVLVGSGNRILYMLNGTSGSTISGITFKNGDCTANAKSSSPPEDNNRGGAICLRSDRDVSTISNCIFEGNTAKEGGAVANYYGAGATLRYGGNFIDCLFTNNTATSSGGGACYNVGSCVRCTFTKNVASYGIAIRQAHLLDDCDFNDNGNGIKDFGTVYNDATHSSTNQTIVNCRFRRNVSKTFGGALYSSGNGNSTLVKNCLFESNSVTATSSIKGEGGAVYGMTNVVGCVFEGNSAYNGGAVSNGKFFGCVFSGNVATSGNGGAATGCTLYACTNRFNVANGGNASECNGTFAKDCLFDGMACTEGYAMFLNCGFDRCRFRNATSGSMFGDSSFITNSLIENCAGTDGNKIYFFHKVTTAMDMINCTIVGNSFRYFRYGTCYAVGQVVNCLLYGNKFSNVAVDIDNLANQCVAGFTNCIYAVKPENEAAYVPGTGGYNYYGTDFNPGFVGAGKDQHNPYSLMLNSPIVTTYHGLNMDWMATATDIRGEGYPRLRDGNVDIGCYQCWLKPPGTQMFFR